MNLGDQTPQQQLCRKGQVVGPIDSRVGQEHSVKVEKKALVEAGAANKRKA